MSKRHAWTPVALLVPALWTLTPAELDYAPGISLALPPEPKLMRGAHHQGLLVFYPSDDQVVLPEAIVNFIRPPAP